jgi:hypothetical protein
MPSTAVQGAGMPTMGPNSWSHWNQPRDPRRLRIRLVTNERRAAMDHTTVAAALSFGPAVR